MTISSVDASHLIGQLKCGNAAGSDDLCANISSMPIIDLMYYYHCVLLYLFTHSYKPSSIIKTIIVPIVKNKCTNVSDSNNYRPIALANIMFKLFESAILLKSEMVLDTCPNQFGFKKGHSKDMCIYVLKEMI